MLNVLMEILMSNLRDFLIVFEFFFVVIKFLVIQFQYSVNVRVLFLYELYLGNGLFIFRDEMSLYLQWVQDVLFKCED